MNTKPMARALLALVALSCFVAPSVADSPVPTPAAEEGTPWVWVVPRIQLGAGQDWTLSGYFGGLGQLSLDCVLLDREGRITASGRWELVAGVPTDYRLAGLEGAPEGQPLCLMVSGLEVGPSWLALSLWSSSPAAPSVEHQGDWIRSDPSWLAGVRREP